jgi:uncharacterized membrane protein HdeD (DUF308 family)
MFIAPGSPEQLQQTVTRDFAERVAKNWWVLFLNGFSLIVAGVLIFSIDWSVRSLSIFIGALFILQGFSTALAGGLDRTAQRTNLVAGLLSIAAGVAIMVWPHPGLVAVGVFLGAWLIVMGTITITGAFAARDFIPDWWMWLILGLLEIPLGVLALADPGATLAAFVTVAGIWAVAVGVMYVVLAFQLRRLPDRVDAMMKPPADGSRSAETKPDSRPRSSSGGGLMAQAPPAAREGD